MKRLSLALVLAAILFVHGFPGPGLCMGAAGGEAGRVTAATGMSTIQRDSGQSVPAAVGALLFPGDEITTGPDSTLEFTLSGMGEFSLGGDTRLDLDEVFSGDEDEPGVLSLAAGYLLSVVDTGHRRPVEVHTPTSVAGVRGTEFETVVALDGSSAVAVDQGTVEVTAEDRSVTLTTGQMSQAGPDLAPEPAAPAPEKARRNWAGWREKRRADFLARLPAGAARLRATMERLDRRAQRDRERVLARAGDAGRMSARLKSLAKARGKAGREARRQARKDFSASLKDLRTSIQSFRRSASRARACAGQGRMVSGALKRNRARYGAQADSAEADLKRVEDLARSMRAGARDLRKQIRKEFKEFRKLTLETKS